MKSLISSILSIASSKGTTLETVTGAVTNATAWLNRQSYAAESKEFVRNLSFSIGGLPNFGRQGGTFTLSKVSGSFGVSGSVNGGGSFPVTLSGFVAAAKRLPQANDEAVKAAEAEAAAANAEHTRLQAEYNAAKARHEAALAKAEAARTARKSGLGSAVSSFFA